MPRKPGRGHAATGARYSEAERFQRECERVLLPSWQPACHVSDLPGPGTAVRVDFLGRSAFVIRGSDGALRAFVNACRHRGSRLIEGDPHTALAYCVGSKLRCPYHAWVYDETGALVHVPGEERYPGLDPGQLALRPLPLATGLGFVFVAFEVPARPLADMLAPLADGLGPYRVDALRRIAEPRLRPHRADWKLLCEHSLDRYRLASLPFVAGADAGFAPRAGAADDALCLSARIAADDGRPWPARAYARWLQRVQSLPPGREGTWSRCFLWPNVVLDLYPDQVRVTQVLPLAPGEAAVRETVLAHPDGSREMRLARYLNARIRRRTAAEEQRLVERRQAGLANGLGPGPLAADEHGLRWFEERVSAALGARG